MSNIKKNVEEMSICELMDDIIEDIDLVKKEWMSSSVVKNFSSFKRIRTAVGRVCKKRSTLRKKMIEAEKKIKSLKKEGMEYKYEDIIHSA